MFKTTEEALKDIREYPENHRHDLNGLTVCCTINGAVDLSLMEAHAEYVNLGTNGGVKCDVVSGPCACGAWH